MSSGSNNSYQSFPLAKAAEVRMLILDVDGVLTEGHIFLSDMGEQSKEFNVRDGHGLKMLQRTGVKIAILTGRTSQVVEHRAKELGIEYVVQGSLKKSEGLDALVTQSGIDPQECAYMGDDIVDLSPMRRCGFTAAPADAHVAVLEAVDWVAGHAGGRGAVRQLCEALIFARGDWGRVITQPYGVSPADCGWCFESA